MLLYKSPAIKTRRRARREERRKELCGTLFQPFGDPVLSDAIISLIFLKPGVMPSGVDAGDSGCPAPHAIVKHSVACVSVCADEIFKQRGRLLRRVQAPLAVDL